MTEITYQELQTKLGEPLVERHVAGTTGVRADNWSCGCLRIVRLRAGEMDIEFHPCQEHAAKFAGLEVL